MSQYERALLLHGVFLALTDALTAYFWKTWVDKNSTIFYQLDKFPPICGPLWQSCNVVRELIPPETLTIILNGGLVAMVAMSLASSAIFMHSFLYGPKKAHWAKRAMALSMSIKILFVLSDYRLDHNSNKMVIWSQLAFLLPISSARRTDILRTLLVSYYLWPGVMKFESNEWVSGALLKGRQLWPSFLFTPAVTKVSLCYGVILEVVWAWGLMACERSWLLTLTLLQFTLFHTSSFSVISYFLPLVMFSLLSIIPVIILFPAEAKNPRSKSGENKDESLLHKFFTGRAGTLTYVAFLVYAACNLHPKLVMPGKRPLSGEGRLLALHMFEGSSYCNYESFANIVDLNSNEREPLETIEIFKTGWVGNMAMVCK